MVNYFVHALYTSVQNKHNISLYAHVRAVFTKKNIRAHTYTMADLHARAGALSYSSAEAPFPCPTPF